MAIEQILNRYDVERRIGSGGMGDVFEAQDNLLGRRVAIKFVGERELRENPGAAAILSDEARHAGQLLGHPHVVSVLDLVDVDTPLHQGPAVVLEYLDGCHVGEWIELHRPKLDAVTNMQLSLLIGLQATDALQYAHKRQILHRDVKPGNILLSTEGAVKVADFGLSRVVEEITRTHTVWGRNTPLYSAPEQWRGEKPDKDSDAYQLGATLYHLLAGEPANPGGTFYDLWRWHEDGTVRPLVEVVPTVDVTVASVIERALAKDPIERPNLWEMFDALSNALVKTKVRMRIRVDGEEGPVRDEIIRRIAELTDYGEQKIAQGDGPGIVFPHSLEAIQEAIGVVLLGGIPEIKRV